MRFEIRLACWLRSRGHKQTIEGLTLNLSRWGALIRINGGRMLEAGEVILAEVPLPPHRLFNQRCLACKGVAVRTFKEEQGCLVAVRFDHMEFRDLREPGSEAAVPLAVM